VLTPEPANALELRNIRAGYGTATVLRDVSLVVPAAKVVALLGPNGAGKTTLLKVASGLLRMTAGTLHLNGRDVTGQGTHRLARQGVCHIPEGHAVFPSLSVQDNLLLFSKRNEYGPSLEKAVAAFPPLGPRLNRAAGSLSGGEQQMLAMVRAYISGPGAVLVDEASLGLAPRVIDELYLFLRRLSSSGTALLLVEQYVQRALAIADEVYILRQGQIVFSGTPAQLESQDLFAQYLGDDAPTQSARHDSGR
jgi:branched-chain amino acid transport system ATP-binding protein